MHVFITFRTGYVPVLFLPCLSNVQCRSCCSIWIRLFIFFLFIQLQYFHFKRERMLLLQTLFHESCIFGNRGNDRTSVLTKYIPTIFWPLLRKFRSYMKTNTTVIQSVILWFLPEIWKKSKVGLLAWQIFLQNLNIRKTNFLTFPACFSIPIFFPIGIITFLIY